MVISEQKNISEILEYLKGAKKVILTGCSECASLCKVGGEEELEEMKNILESEGIEVVGKKVLTTSCNLLLDKRELKEFKKEFPEVDAILSMACGDGVQTVSNVVKVPVYPANDTMFIGEIKRNGVYEETCKACGECVLGRTASVCPITRCSKSLLNGPCGGSKNGKCEVNPESDCAWIEIYNRLKKIGKEELMLEIDEPRNYGRAPYPRKIDIREKSREVAI